MLTPRAGARMESLKRAQSPRRAPLLRRAHEARGHGGDQAARGEALGFHHEAVAGAGDDQGFAAGERVQTDADDLFGGFGGAEGVVRLGGYLLEFGGGGAGAERSDVYAMR